MPQGVSTLEVTDAHQNLRFHPFSLANLGQWDGGFGGREPGNPVLKSFPGITRECQKSCASKLQLSCLLFAEIGNGLALIVVVRPQQMLSTTYLVLSQNLDGPLL